MQRHCDLWAISVYAQAREKDRAHRLPCALPESRSYRQPRSNEG